MESLSLRRPGSIGAAALLQAANEFAHMCTQRSEQIVGVPALFQHQAAEQLGADHQRGALVAGEAALPLVGLQYPHPVVVAAVLEFDGAAAHARLAILFD